MKQLIAIAVLCLSIQAMAQEGSLKVTVTNFESGSGSVKIALYNSEETYMGKPFQKQDKQLNDATEVNFVFEDLPTGKYTFSIYHDANGNGELDKNMMGIPTEDYAFSNNANGRFGPPEYSLCVFEVGTETVNQTINLN